MATSHSTISDGYKQCSSGENCCNPSGPIQPATLEYFKPDNRVKSGLAACCRECHREYSRKRYYRQEVYQRTAEMRATPEYKKRHREYLRSEKYKRYERKYRQTEKYAEKEQRVRNSPKFKARQRAYKNSPKYKRYVKAYHQRQEVKRRYQAKEQRRRAIKKSLPDSFTADDWQRCLDHWNGRCCYCGDRPAVGEVLEADHYIPLNSKKCPGTITTNMVPACKQCNCSKNARMPEQWIRKYLKPDNPDEVIQNIKDYFNSL